MSTTNERSQNDIVVGDGVVTVVPFQFNYFPDSNISVLVTLRDETDPDNIVETEFVESTDYNLFDDRIELVNPLLTDQFLLVERIVKDVQPLDYDDLRPFPEEIHERQEDRTFMSLAEIKNKFSRTILFNKFMENSIIVEDPVDGNFLQYQYDPLLNQWTLSNSEALVDLSNYYTKPEVDGIEQGLQSQINNITGSLVTSVNTQTGAVVLDTDDIPEGAVNEYHTTAKARAAAVVNSMAGSQTDQAPSVDAVSSELNGITSDISDLQTDKLDIVNLTAGTNISITGTGTNIDPLVVNASGSVSVEWGDLTGTLSDQTDLQNALDAKENAANKVTSMSSPDNTSFPTTKAVDDLVLSLFPVGMIMSTLADVAPNSLNWIKLNSQDQSFSITTYQDLYDYLFNNNLIFDISLQTNALFYTDGTPDTFFCAGLGAYSPRGVGQITNWDDLVKDGPDAGLLQQDQMQRITASSGNDDNDQIRGSGNLGDNASGAFSFSGSSTYSYSGYVNSGGARIRTLHFNSANSPDARTSATTEGETRANTFGVFWWIRY